MSTLGFLDVVRVRSDVEVLVEEALRFKDGEGCGGSWVGVGGRVVASLSGVLMLSS